MRTKTLEIALEHGDWVGYNGGRRSWLCGSGFKNFMRTSGFPEKEIKCIVRRGKCTITVEKNPQGEFKLESVSFLGYKDPLISTNLLLIFIDITLSRWLPSYGWFDIYIEG